MGKALRWKLWTEKFLWQNESDYLEGNRFNYRSGMKYSEVFNGFHQTFHVNAGRIPPSRPRRFLSRYFSYHMMHRKQMALVIRVFAIRVFAYLRFYFGFMRNISILSAAAVVAAAQAHWVARAHFHWLAPPFWLWRIEIKASHGVSLWKSTGMWNVSRFTRFRYTRRFARTQPPCITRVACISYLVLRQTHYRLRLAPFPSPRTASADVWVQTINVVASLYYEMVQKPWLYSSPNMMIKPRRLVGWAGHVVRMGEIRNAYNILVGKPEGRIPH
jgi:hypothetical protein